MKITKQNTKVIDYLSATHLLMDEDWTEEKRQSFIKNFIKLENSNKEFTGFILHYDFYKSTKYFKNYYAFISDHLFPFIEELACQYDFRWRGGLCGDGAFLCLANALDPDLELSFIEAFEKVCRFSQDLFKIFYYLSHQDEEIDLNVNLDEHLAKELKDIAAKNDADFFLLRIGISYGQLAFSNSVASLSPVYEEQAHALLEAQRISCYGWGTYLASNPLLREQLRKNGINDYCFIKKIADDLCLIRIDNILSKRSLYNGYRIVQIDDDKEDYVSQINFKVDLISSWSEHNHFEGNYATVHRDLSMHSKISLEEFINHFETWRMQKRVLQASAKENDSEKRKKAMLEEIEKFTLNIIDNLSTQEIERGYLFISPFNLARDVNNITDLRADSVKDRVVAALDAWPEDFKALKIEDYLVKVREVLDRSHETRDLKLILALRRDRVEGWYLRHPDSHITRNFIDQMISLREQGLIFGVDICGVEQTVSISDMTCFLQKINKYHLLHSIHAGEMPAANIFIALNNIIRAVDIGVRRIGQGYAYFYLLNANQHRERVLSDEQIMRLYEKLKPGSKRKEQLTQQELAEVMSKFLQKRDVILQVNLVSNIFTVLTEAPGKKDVSKKSFLKKFRYHPLVNLIIDNGVEHLDQIPKLTLSADDYAITGYTLKQELQVLMSILVENNFELEKLDNLLDRLLPDDLDDAFKLKISQKRKYGAE